MRFDPQTVYLLGALAFVASATIVALAARSYPPDLARLGYRWVVGVSCLSVSWLAVGLRGLVSDALSIFAAHGLGLLAFAVFLDCFLRLGQRKTRLAWVYATPAIGVVSAATFYYAIPNYAARVAIFSLLNAGQCAACSWVLFRDRGGPAPVTSRLAGYGFGFGAGLLALRGFVSASVPASAPPITILAVGGLEQLLIVLVFLCTIAASFAFVVLCNERLSLELRKLATLDPLTERFNRRTIDELGRREAARARRHALDLAVALVDIDHFKQVNDRFGHAAGDAALRSVAEAIAAELREPDLLGRYGGDELLVILADTRRDAAEIACERLRQAIAERGLIGGEGESSLTVSIGFAGLNGDEVDFDRLVRRADRALYEAKAAGRDRVRDGSSPSVDETGVTSPPGPRVSVRG
ncbi:MAG: diguanylate cyclase [Thermoanaerobaculia bacterium]